MDHKHIEVLQKRKSYNQITEWHINEHVVAEILLQNNVRIE